MATSDRPGRVVFIGNIPYGLTEEQIIQICSSAGQVLSFRLVYDNDTGRPKGFGFAEFADTDAAASAVRNLNKYPIMGRELRVDFSHVGGKDDAAPAGYQPEPFPSQPSTNNTFGPPSSSAPVTNGLPPLPPGVDVPPNLTCPDAISKTLSTLPAPQLLDIITQMKNLVMTDPVKATELLSTAPQLSYAIFQALLLLGLVDTTVLSSVVEEAARPAGAVAPPPPPPPQATPQVPTAVPAHLQRVPNQPYQTPPHLQSAQQQGYPQPTPQPYQHYQPPPQQVHVPTPQQFQTPYQAPPQPPQQQIPNQDELLKQVLNMPQHDVDRLGPAERAQIMELKMRYGAATGY